MIKVLFICAANINRSPMAEAIFSQLLKNKGLSDQFTVDSAATNKHHVGKPPFPRTRRFLDKMQIPYDWIVSRQVTIHDLETFDYIVAMDQENLTMLKKIMDGSGQTRNIPLLLEYIPELRDKNVPDPSVTGDYMQTYQLLVKGCENLLRYILDSVGLNTNHGNG